MNVHRSVTFYRDAFGLSESFIHESGGYAEVESEGIGIAFASRKMLKTHLPLEIQDLVAGKAPPFEVCFIVEDVDAVYAQALDVGALSVQDPQEKPWGQRVAYVKDPDGFLLEIGAKMRR